jgi:hypothetical protein
LLVQTQTALTDLEAFGLVRGEAGHLHHVSELMAEARILARLNHPNIAHLFGVVHDLSGHPYWLVRERGITNLGNVLQTLRRTHASIRLTVRASMQHGQAVEPA